MGAVFALGFLFIAVIIIAVLVIGFIIAVAEYIFEGLFLSRVLTRSGCGSAFRGWIPVYNKYILAKAAGKDRTGKFLAAAEILGSLSFTAFVVMIAVLTEDTDTTMHIDIAFMLTVFFMCADFVLKIYLSHVIMQRAGVRYADLLTVLNIITAGFSRGIVLYTVRNNCRIVIDPRNGGPA